MIRIPHEKFSAIIENVIRNSIEENFQQGGRWGNGALGGGNTTWEKSKRAIAQGGQTLQDTGQLAASIRVSSKASGGITIDARDQGINISADGGFEVTIGSNKKVGGKSLAAIMQYGGSWRIPVTEKMKDYFWSQFYKTKDVKWKYMAMTTKDAFKINMPKRPFLVVQDEDIIKIWEKYVEFISRNI